MYYEHGYVVLDTNTLSSGQRLVKLYNPHSRDSFTGGWSDFSRNWSRDLRKEVGLDRDREDGFTYMAIEDYYSNMSSTFFTIDNTDWAYSYFLKLDD